MWNWDGPTRYYSDPTRKYITYDNPPLKDVTDANQVIKMEENALINALAIGMILNGTVILSPFQCSENMMLRCGLNSSYKISAFDSQFRRDYRESIYLCKALVPDNKRKSVSATFLIQTHADESHFVQGDLS